MKGLIQLKLREFFLYFKDLGSVDDDPIEGRFRRLEEEFKSKIDQLQEKVNELMPLKEEMESKFDRLNDDNKKLNDKVNELLPLKDEVNELKETVKKQETEIQRLLGNQRDDKETNKQDNAAVSIVEGGF